VWKTPITRLAKEYGLSDVGLAKICKKHDIPRPPRGYWAKKEGGWLWSPGAMADIRIIHCWGRCLSREPLLLKEKILSLGKASEKTCINVI
jgi:hypothetical protein